MLARTDPLTVLHAALRDRSLEWVDLTHPLSDATPIIELPEPYANTPGWSLDEVSHYDERGPLFYWNSFGGSEHMGTHFDAPLHWITGRDGDDVSSVPAERLSGPAVVLDRTAAVVRDPDYLLTIEDVRAFEGEHGPLPQGGWLLFRTGWSARYWDRNSFLMSDERGTHWPGVDPDCARFLAEETEILGFGVEQIGIDAGCAHELDPPWPAHHYLLGSGKYGLAQLANLERLPASGSTLIAAPLRILNGSGSPARVLALARTAAGGDYPGTADAR
jgi:kynurenine formamidase